MLRQLQAKARERSEIWLGGINRWTILEWTGALCGEAGEASNCAKKIRRIELNAVNPKGESLEELRTKLARELADTVIYAALTAEILGIDLEDVITDVFNTKSKELGAAIMLQI